MTLAIALDVGSSSIKGGLLDLDQLSIRTTVQRPFPSPVTGLGDGRHEVEPEDVVDRCRQVIDELARAGEIAALFFCGQHGGCVLFDPVTRRAIGRYISWRDDRTNAVDPNDPLGRTFLEQLRSEIGEALLTSVGREISPGGTVATAAWLDRRGQLPSGAVPLGIGEYVLARLGGADPMIERTCAVGMIDVNTMRSPNALYERIGLSKLPWPRIVEFHEAAGHVRVHERAVPAFPVVGDHQCALAGALLGERELSINISTGSQVSLLAPRATGSPRYQTRCYFGGLLLNTLTHLPAGRALNVFVDLLCELSRRAGHAIENPWSLITPLLSDRQAADSDLRVRTTLFKGPLGDRGAVENISVSNLSAAALIHAALLDMAANYRAVTTTIASEQEWDRIALSGGLAQKLQPLRDAIAAQFPGRSIRISSSEEETLQGMLALALTATGRCESLAQAATMIAAHVQT